MADSTGSTSSAPQTQPEYDWTTRTHNLKYHIFDGHAPPADFEHDPKSLQTSQPKGDLDKSRYHSIPWPSFNSIHNIHIDFISLITEPVFLLTEYIIRLAEKGKLAGPAAGNTEEALPIPDEEVVWKFFDAKNRSKRMEEGHWFYLASHTEEEKRRMTDETFILCKDSPYDRERLVRVPELKTKLDSISKPIVCKSTHLPVESQLLK